MATASARLKAILWRQGALPDVEHDVVHTRAVLYLRGGGWLVVDRIETASPRRITPLWHFHPDCTVVRQGQSVVTTDKDVGNLRIQPLGGIPWEIEFVRGREGPDFQGWYSPKMGVRVPNTCACYSAEIAHTTTLAWILLPARGAVPIVECHHHSAPEGTVHLDLLLPGGKCWEIAVKTVPNAILHLADGTPVKGMVAVRRVN